VVYRAPASLGFLTPASGRAAAAAWDHRVGQHDLLELLEGRERIEAEVDFTGEENRALGVVAGIRDLARVDLAREPRPGGLLLRDHESCPLLLQASHDDGSAVVHVYGLGGVTDRSDRLVHVSAARSEIRRLAREGGGSVLQPEPATEINDPEDQRQDEREEERELHQGGAPATDATAARFHVRRFSVKMGSFFITVV
jgi:hypothetical protein